MKLNLLVLILFCISCSTKKEVVQNDNIKLSEQILVLEPPVLIYKTKKNYNDLVPVLLSDGKTIISYPHPKDLIVGNGYPLPTVLHGGYLIDNRGIGKNVAFLSITYEEYTKLKNVPSIEELYKLIIDKDPFIELCNCGTKTNFTNLEKEINYLIANNKLKTICKLIK